MAEQFEKETLQGTVPLFSETEVSGKNSFKKHFVLLITAIALQLFSLAGSYAQTISITGANAEANGISQGSLILGQNNIVLFGFGLTVYGTTTITEFNIGASSPDSRNSYFNNYRLYRSVDNVFSASDTLLSTNAIWRKNSLTNINLSGFTETYNAPNGQTAYYFLIADYTNDTGIVPGSIQFNFTPKQKDDAVVAGKSTYNNFSISGTAFTMSPAEITLISTNSVSSGITPALITFGQQNIVLFGFGLKVKGVSTISEFNISSSNTIGNYFTNGKLYRSTDNLYSADDALISSFTINKNTVSNLSITGLSENFNWSPDTYYFLLADYGSNGPVQNNTIQFKFTNNQTSPAIVQSAPQKYSYNNFDISGQLFSFARTSAWLGSDSLDASNWHNSLNWSGGFVPGSSDIAYIGTQSFATQPSIRASTSVGSITLGTTQQVILSIDSGVTLNAGDIIQKATDASIINTISGRGSLFVNNLQLSDAAANTANTANRTTKLVSDISSSTYNNIILRSKWNIYSNDAHLELRNGDVTIKGQIQTINAAQANRSTLTASPGTVINLLDSVPFTLSTTGNNQIQSAGLIRYNSLSAQNIETQVSYKDLSLDGAGVKTILTPVSGGQFYLDGSLSITSPATITYAPAINSINIRGNFEGTSSLRAINLPVSIGGNWLNSAKDSLQSNVYYDGNADQIVGGLKYTNVFFTNGGAKTLQDSASVKGNLEVGQSTLLNTRNMLTLRADSISTANVRPLLNGADIQGKVRVQSFIKGGKRVYLTITSPVYDTLSSDQAIKALTFSQIKKFVPVTGTGGPANGFDIGSSINPYGPTLWIYHEPAPSSQVQYLFPSKITDTISVGRGFYVFFRGDRTNIYNKVNPPFSIPEDVLMEYEGFVNKGDIKVPLSFTKNSSPNDDGVNMIGNPYPSAIDIHTLLEGTPYSKIWVLTFSGTYAVYDITLGTGTNGASRYIIPGQGFFIQTKSPATLTFTENCKINTNNHIRIMSDPKSPGATVSASSRQASNKQYLRMQAKNLADGLTDETIIVFNAGSSSKRTDEDAGYFNDAKVMLGSLSDDQELLAINYHPKTEGDSRIKLYVNGEASGNYSLSLMENFYADFSDILLQDNYLGTTVSLKSSTVYKFSIDTNITATFGGSRFVLIFKRTAISATVQQITTSSDEADDKNIFLYPNPVQTHFQIKLAKNNSSIEVRIYNTFGQMVKANKFYSSDIINMNVSALTPGTYVAEITNTATNILLARKKFIKE